MKRFVVGTAGHVDHGKTRLVHALTGVDCDRWEEEKRRGITIDLGFASMIEDGWQIGFVDVPGHERFVRNALAGLGGIQMMVLVVAADEGVMPQTLEHLAICSLLRIPAGVAVLSKTDLVPPDLLELAQLELEETLADTPFAEAPILPVSSETGAGLERLRETLVRLAGEAAPIDRHSGLPARLPIDRAFHLKGLGVLVTGTLARGTVTVGAELDILPSGARARVRSIEVHGDSRERAEAGERTSLQLVGVGWKTSPEATNWAHPASTGPRPPCSSASGSYRRRPRGSREAAPSGCTSWPRSRSASCDRCHLNTWNRERRPWRRSAWRSRWWQFEATASALQHLVAGLALHHPHGPVVVLDRVGHGDHGTVPGSHPARQVVHVPVAEPFDPTLLQQIRRVEGLDDSGSEPAAGLAPRQALEPFEAPVDDLHLVVLGRERALHPAVADELPVGGQHGLGALRIDVGAERVHEGAGPDAAFGEDAHDPRHADPHAVLDPGVVSDVGDGCGAVGLRDHGAGHGALERPVFDIDDHVHHQRLAVERGQVPAFAGHPVGNAGIGLRHRSLLRLVPES